MAQLRVELVVPARTVVVQPHHPLVALLAGHQLGNHCAVLLVDIRFVNIWPTNRAAFIALVVLAGALNLGQLDLAVVPVVVVRTHLALHVVPRQHRVVQGDAVLRRVALPLVLVVIYAVNVDDPFVVVTRVAIDLD